MTKMLRLLLGTVTIVLLAGTWPAYAAPSPLSAQDQQYVSANGQTNLGEIAAAKLALRKSESASVRALATAMENDHEKAEAQLAGVAKTAGAQLPTSPSPVLQQQAAKIAKLPGAAFDDAFLKDQVTDHKQSVARTQQEIASSSDPALVAYAKTYLVTAQQHLGMANQALLAAHPTESRTPRPVASGSAAAGEHHGSSNLPWVVGIAAILVIAAAGGVGRLGRAAKRGR